MRGSRGVAALAVLACAFTGVSARAATATTEWVSRANDGSQPDGGSYSPVMSADCRYVLFTSDADNLTGTDIRGVQRLGVRDSEACFVVNCYGTPRPYLRDRVTGTTELLGIPPVPVGAVPLCASGAAMSADARFVLLDGCNGITGNAVIVDRQTGQLTPISYGHDTVPEWNVTATRGLAVSSAGVVLYEITYNKPGMHGGSWFTTTYVLDLVSNVWKRVGSFESTSVPADHASMSDDGRLIAFMGGFCPTSTCVVDRITGALRSVTATVNATNAAVYYATISGDGTHVAGFVNSSSVAADIVDVDLATGATSVVTGPPPPSPPYYYQGMTLAVSRAGDRVAFVSSRPDLVAGDTNGVGDAFVADVNTGTVTRVSVAADGSQGSSWVGTSDDYYTHPGAPYLSVSADGNSVAFDTLDGLVPGDTDQQTDVYVHELQVA